MAEVKGKASKTGKKEKPHRVALEPPGRTPIKEGFPVVAIGASAGGLEALEQFFKIMPVDSRSAFIVISHLDPKHGSMMSELLSRCTGTPVSEAGDGVRVEPDHIYVIPPNFEMAIFHGRLQLTPLPDSRGIRMPIDFFFRSLAEDQGDKGVAIILSGTGTDGTLGLRAVHGAGGTVFVQDPDDARYDGMPRSAIQTGLADYILPAGGMAAELVSFLRNYGKKKREALIGEERPSAIQKILMLLRSKTGHDFSLYKKTTVNRRIQRRMGIHAIDDALSYGRYLEEHPEEVHQLFKELLISVTSFFRDHEAFDALKNDILPVLLDRMPGSHVFRAWVPGCATGEEAYSVAMTVREYIDAKKVDCTVQIFATDIDEDSIMQARSGIYPSNISVDVPADRLKRFFLKDDKGYRIRKEVREMVVFAVQNVIKDAPFTRLDLLSCRNLMIYLEPALQERLITLFHYSLAPGGMLFLGSSESIGRFADLFSAIDKKWKFFQAKPTMGTTGHAAVTGTPWPRDYGPEEPVLNIKRGQETGLAELVHRTLLSSFAPPSVVVNDKGDTIYVYGNTGKYLRPAPGLASLNIVEMAREGLGFEMRAALQHVVNSGKETKRPGLRVGTNGGETIINLTVKPLPRAEEGPALFIFIFEEPPPKAEPKGPRKAAPRADQRIGELETELAYTRESLQASIEELQAANEELKSTNEEMQSTNEELQSTNEEMETSKEELQSVNEELVTVNSELQSKIEQLSDAENDMRNLLDSTEIATVFLENNLRIKRFTRPATKVINLIPADVGRPLGDIVSNIEHQDIVGGAREVLERLISRETEVRTKEGAWYLMRIMPYRTIDNAIDGVVITFTDITDTKRASKEREEFSENIVQTVREPLLVLDEDLRVLTANKAFYERFKKGKEEIQGRPIQDIANRQWSIPALEDLLFKVARNNEVFEDFRVDHDSPALGKRTMMLNARKIAAPLPGDKDKRLILLAMEDVTDKEAR